MLAVNRPVIGIFVKNKDADPEFKDAQYELAYTEIVEVLIEKGADAVILMGQGRYEGSGVFSKSWSPRRDAERIFYNQRGRTRVDLVFDKDNFVDDDTIPVINPRLLKAICENKHMTYEVLQEFQPKSSVVHTHEDFLGALKTLPGDVAVVKGLHGNSGDAVFIGAKSDAAANMEHVELPYQVQEFVETSQGIPGVVDTRHDLRLLMMGGEPILATLRTPPKDGYKSNLGYGGMNRLVDLSELPDELFSMAHGIDKVLEQFAPFRLYSADFGHTDKGWKLFEVNGLPGVITRERGEVLARAYQEKLAQYIIDMYDYYVTIKTDTNKTQNQPRRPA